MSLEVNTQKTMDWRELHETAINRTVAALDGRSPSKELFLDMYKEYYDSLLKNHSIKMYPVDPPGSRRMGISRATKVWTDDYSD